MNNKRMFRPKGRGISPTSHPVMQRASKQMAMENYSGAALTFEKMAERANSRNGPAAPHLFIQAGRANFLARQIPNGMVDIHKGLKLFAERKDWLRFGRNRKRVVKQLRRMGNENEANELMNFMAGELPADMDAIENEPQLDLKTIARANASLPNQCQKCGAPVRSDEVEWVDDRSAECSFCGNIIQSEDTNSRDVDGAQRI